MNKLISIIIVNWNGRLWLKGCLDSLVCQTNKNYEIIIVDNGSSDGSVEFIKNNYKNVILIEGKNNLGFAGGNNLGFKYSNGEYILLLNNDTVTQPDYLEKFIEVFVKNPNLGSAQSKIILMDNSNRLDVCGSYWTDTSFLFHYGYRQNADRPEYNRSRLFFSNKGASMMVKRDAIEMVGGLFDEDFWCYYEETDLCHRLWLGGYECGYCPEAVVYHHCGVTSGLFRNDYIQFHNFKNKLLSFLKNFELLTLTRVLPTYFVINGVLGFYWFLCGRWKLSVALYQSVWWNIVNIRQTMAKRSIIQTSRRISDRDIFNKVKRNPELSYYYYLLRGLHNYVQPVLFL